MNSIKALCGALVLTIAIVGQSRAEGWYTADSIRKIQVTESGLILPFANSSVNHECGSTALRLNDPTSLGADRILSVLLANQMTGRKMQFYIVGCDGTRALFDRIEDNN